VAGPRSRTTSWHDPHDVIVGMAGVAGLEALRRMIAGEIPYPPIADTFAMRIVELERGRVVWEAEPGEHLYNPIGTVHAGFVTTLLDSAMGTAFVRCTGTIVHRGRTVVTTEAKAEDAEGRLLAHATSTILVLDS
jgi:acyl-coenzyme A thioesterase PaaI-like protein